MSTLPDPHFAPDEQPLSARERAVLDDIAVLLLVLPLVLVTLAWRVANGVGSARGGSAPAGPER